MSNYHQKKDEQRKKVAYTLTVEQIRQIEERACRRGIEEGLHILIGLVCLVLHNSFGFGPMRCQVVADRMLSMFGRMDTPGGVTLQDVKKAARDYGGVKAIL